MNKDIFEGKWEETKGQMKQLWGKLYAFGELRVA